MATDVARRELRVLVARDDLSIARATCAPGEQITRRHVHREHTDAFYVLEGRLVFDVGGDTITVSAGDFVAVPPNVPHSFRATEEAPARWLTIHAPDGGFAEFIRHGGDVPWDVAPA
jgi:mannose-6-phosphate isomerase-like protein (cupin superfamily)